mmetsp:Transcript_28071/g.89616  ORF Transcript_28071/g.89616 Transcript_28071/m.89616 type:complete len:200 (-) Transcript_28071:867-1466(-)
MQLHDSVLPVDASSVSASRLRSSAAEKKSKELWPSPETCSHPLNILSRGHDRSSSLKTSCVAGDCSNGLGSAVKSPIPLRPLHGSSDAASGKSFCATSRLSRQFRPPRMKSPPLSLRLWRAHPLRLSRRSVSERFGAKLALVGDSSRLNARFRDSSFGHRCNCGTADSQLSCTSSSRMAIFTSSLARSKSTSTDGCASR